MHETEFNATEWKHVVMHYFQLKLFREMHAFCFSKAQRAVFSDLFSYSLFSSFYWFIHGMVLKAYFGTPYQKNVFSSAVLSLVFLQVYIHWHLHIWVFNKDVGQRLLSRVLHISPRPLELAGFQCHRHGVSMMII